MKIRYPLAPSVQGSMQYYYYNVQFVFAHLSTKPKGKWQKKYVVVVQVDVSTLWDILWPTIPGELPYHKK